MPRQKDRMTEIILEHVQRLVEAIREETRREVRERIDGALSGNGKVARRSAAGGPKRIIPCISPGCKNQSKGPRFRYLCEEHKGASAKQVEQWRKQKKEAEKKEATV